MPFYRLHRRTYAAYWDLFTPKEWDEKQVEYAAEGERHRKLELATVGSVQPGEMQPERDYNMQGEKTWPARVLGRPCRRGKSWFSFDMPVEPARPMALIATYYREEWRKRTFKVLIDGEELTEQVVQKGGPPRFFDVKYRIPKALVGKKKTVTVRFEALEGSEIAAVFGLRMIRADAER